MSRTDLSGVSQCELPLNVFFFERALNEKVLEKPPQAFRVFSRRPGLRRQRLRTALIVSIPTRRNYPFFRSMFCEPLPRLRMMDIVDVKPRNQETMCPRRFSRPEVIQNRLAPSRAGLSQAVGAPLRSHLHSVS